MTRQTILIVEDNPLNLELVTDVLEAAGYSVRHASTAEEGIRSARTDLPDLILLDISLPGMDGHAAVRELKADPQLQHIPAIALTALAMAGDEQRAGESGFDGFITKPIHTRTFPQTVARWLPAKEVDR